MNYLAHFYLSYPYKHMMVGNFIADQVKGKSIKKLSDPVAEGVVHHRKIDAFTDNHPIVKKAKKRIFPEYGHYSGVILDMFYDFFLANNWELYSNTNLEVFTEDCYQVLNVQLNEMPIASQRIYTYMSRQNWLYHYQTIEGIKQALGGISRRSSFDNDIDTSVRLLYENRAVLEEEFFEFFDALQEALKV